MSNYVKIDATALKIHLKENGFSYNKEKSDILGITFSLNNPCCCMKRM